MIEELKKVAEELKVALTTAQALPTTGASPHTLGVVTNLRLEIEHAIVAVGYVEMHHKLDIKHPPRIT